MEAWSPWARGRGRAGLVLATNGGVLVDRAVMPSRRPVRVRRAMAAFEMQQIDCIQKGERTRESK